MIYQSLPYTNVWVKKSFLTGPNNFKWGKDEMIPAVLVGIKAVFNCAPLYEIYIPEYGACYDKTLQCAIFNKPESPDREIRLPDVAWWDCIAPEIQVYEKRMFRNVFVKMQNKKKHWFQGTYLWTVDFVPPHTNSGIDLSEAQLWSEHKQKNYFFDDETGALVCGPNNKMRYICESLCPPDLKKPFFKVFEGTDWSHQDNTLFYGNAGNDFDYEGQKTTKKETDKPLLKS